MYSVRLALIPRATSEPRTTTRAWRPCAPPSVGRRGFPLGLALNRLPPVGFPTSAADNNSRVMTCQQFSASSPQNTVFMVFFDFACDLITRVLLSAPVITVNTKRVALKRGIKSPYELAKRLGRTEDKPPTGMLVLAHRLWKGKPRPTLDTIDKLMDALGDCDLSELLIHTPNRRTRSRTPPKNKGRNGHG